MKKILFLAVILICVLVPITASAQRMSPSRYNPASVAITGGTVYFPEYDNGTCTTTKVIAPLNGMRHKITLGAACGVSFTQPASGTVNLMIKVVQATGAAYNITWTSVKWPSAVAPVITATDAAVDLFSCYLDGTNTYCNPAQDLR